MDTNAAALKSKRKTYIDFLRIVAIYMVLFNHSGKNGMMLFTISRQSPFYPFYLFNSIFIKIAVPLFLMISGTLLLGKNESYGDIVKRFIKLEKNVKIENRNMYRLKLSYILYCLMEVF